MELLELMKSRHSVRQYTPAPIEDEKRTALNALAEELNKKSGLHIQIIYDEPKCFNSMMAHYGSFRGCANYISIVGPKDDNLDEKSGYYGEELVLKAQELGLNTCWAYITHGKSKAVINRGEKESIVIALGYGATQGVPHRDRPLTELCNQNTTSPDWFTKGMQAVMLAPTAINQQKFYFELTPDGTKVTAKAFKGPCYKIDLGIVKYHFEAASGHKVE